MGGGDAGETGIAARRGIEMGSLWFTMGKKSLVDEVADAAGFKGAGWLKIFEFEEDAAMVVVSKKLLSCSKKRARTSLRLWKAQMILSMDSLSRVWGYLMVLCYPF